MVFRVDNCTKWCESEKDIREAIDISSYYGYADYIKDNTKISAISQSHTQFILEFTNEDGEEVKLKAKHIWTSMCSDIIIIDGQRYSKQILFEVFGGIYFRIGFR